MSERAPPDFDNCATALEGIFDGFYQIDRAGRVLSWNKAAEGITGFRAEEIVGTISGDNQIRYAQPGGEEIGKAELPLLGTLRDGRPREFHASMLHAEGFRISILARTLPFRDPRGIISGAAEIFTDNRALLAAFLRNQRVEHTVLFDPLTGIGNRAHIETKVKFAIEDYETARVPFGIIFLDIDHFKLFNDTHGHLIGDIVLRFVANSLREHLRVSDSCGRWGGEEFLALVSNVSGDGLQIVAEKLRALIEHSGIPAGGQALHTTVSIGATMVRPQDSLKELLHRADRLMYESKRAGRNRVTVAA